MGSSDFYIDYNIEVSDVGDEFKRETERRLGELASSHSDMIGAAVALEKTADTQTYDVYRVRVLIYKRPQDIVVTKEDSDPMVTLRDALDTLEEQVRASREKTRATRYPSRQPDPICLLRFKRGRNICHLRQGLAA